MPEKSYSRQWRGVLREYADRLNISEATPIVTLGEGGTPLLPAPALSARTGANVFVKFEGMNPTGSFKDRGMTVALSRAVEHGAKAVICASTGNTSASAAAYAAHAGITAAVLVPEGKIAMGKLSQAVAHNGRLIQIRGNFDDCLEIARELADHYPVHLVNSVNPDRIEGQKTAAYEVVEVLGDAPDFHFIPVGNAGNYTAYSRGYREEVARGVATRVPRMFGFQAEGSAPLVRGEVVKNGGRVMKNVTGYDLVKFLAGSYGTLAVMSEVTFKVQPMPEVEATLVLQGLDDRRAIAALAAGLGSPYGVTGAAHVPAQNGTPARTLLRLDGFTASVDYRLGRLAEDLVDFGSAARIEAAPSAALWKSIRDLSVFASPAGVPVWRVSVRPGDGPSVAEAARKSFACRVLYDWGGGLVWIAGGDGPDAGASVIRPAARAAGGYATLARAPEPLRAANDVFDPPASALMALTRRLKDTFDPAGILNPGRMYAGV
ncbi:MAG: threonine synthase [Microbacterium sp.]|nr:threonine synthase [Microbacterium sp.]